MRAVPVGKISSTFLIDCNSCGSSYNADRWEQHEVQTAGESSWDDWLDAYVVSDMATARYLECPECAFKWNYDWKLYSVLDRGEVENAGIETSGGSQWQCAECEQEYTEKSDADECCM